MSKGRVVWFNGELIPEKEAKVSIYDSALLFGDMIFEMTRSFNNKQFKLREHLERLYAGIKILRIPIKMTIDEMEKHVYKTIEANDHLFNEDDEHRIMIDVTRGLLSIYEELGNTEPNIIIADFPLRWTVRGMGELFDTGINAVITSQRAIPADLLDPKIKNRSRIHYLRANIEASQFKGNNNWALLLDTDGFIAEGTGDNFFIVKNDQVITPEGRNILRGISRQYIIEELRHGDVIEKNIDPYDVYTADEAFMTGTPFCILPVTSLNGISIGDGKPGDITKYLIANWSDNVNVDIVTQIKKWNAKDTNNKSNAPSPYRFGGENEDSANSV